MCRNSCLLLCLLWTVSAGAQSGSGDPLDVVPLVDMNAPLVAAWFVAAPEVSLEDASSVEQQVYQDFFKRMDVRVISREKTLERLGSVNRPELLKCNGEEECLIKMGQVLEVDLIVGVILHTEGGNYRLILKSIHLKREPPAQLNSVVEGTLTDLLIGGIAGAVAAAFDNRDQYMPIAPATTPVVTKPVHHPPAQKAPPAPPEPATEPVVAPAPVDEPGEPSGVTVTEAPERAGFFERHLGSALLLGGSLAALGTGITLGSMSQDIASDMEVSYDPDRDQTGRDYALAANILFGVAGAAAVTSVILFFFVEDDQPPPTFTVVPTAGGAHAVVRF